MDNSALIDSYTRTGRPEGLVEEGFNINTGLEGRYVINTKCTLNDQSFIIPVLAYDMVSTQRGAVSLTGHKRNSLSLGHFMNNIFSIAKRVQVTSSVKKFCSQVLMWKKHNTVEPHLMNTMVTPF